MEERKKGRKRRKEERKKGRKEEKKKGRKKERRKGIAPYSPTPTLVK